MKQHYVWLIWSSSFLVPWTVVYLSNAGLRSVMWRASTATALFGVTEPLFVPAYWNPPSLFDLAQRTGFDLESFIFSFAIGGIGTVLYDTVTKRHFAPVSPATRGAHMHRFHLAALLVPLMAFVPLYFLSWNPIYPVLVCLTMGATASVVCRPDLRRKTLIGGFLFLGLYGIFMLGLRLFAAGYIGTVWNLPALSGVLLYGVPLEELLFGFAFGSYWSGVYEHLTWNVGE